MATRDLHWEDCKELLPVVLRISNVLAKLRTTTSVSLKPDRLSVTHGDDANATFYSVDRVSAGRRPFPCRHHDTCWVGAGCLACAHCAVGADADGGPEGSALIVAAV